MVLIFLATFLVATAYADDWSGEFQPRSKELKGYGYSEDYGKYELNSDKRTEYGANHNGKLHYYGKYKPNFGQKSFRAKPHGTPNGYVKYGWNSVDSKGYLARGYGKSKDYGDYESNPGLPVGYGEKKYGKSNYHGKYKTNFCKLKEFSAKPSKNYVNYGWNSVKPKGNNSKGYENLNYYNGIESISDLLLLGYGPDGNRRSKSYGDTRNYGMYKGGFRHRPRSRRGHRIIRTRKTSYNPGGPVTKPTIKSPSSTPTGTYISKISGKRKVKQE